MVKAKAPDEMTEGEKIAEELIDHLEDENSKEKEIRHKAENRCPSASQRKGPKSIAQGQAGTGCCTDDRPPGGRISTDGKY